MKRQATGKKGGKTSNKIKDINRTKYAQEISSEIKDVSVITMNKTYRAHQNRMVCAPGEFCRNKPFCEKSNTSQSEERTFILHWRGNSRKFTITAGFFVGGWPCAGLQPPRWLKENLWTLYVKNILIWRKQTNKQSKNNQQNSQLFNPGRCGVFRQTFSRVNVVTVLQVQLERKQLLLLLNT